jgi:hypothetical protein
MFVAAECTHLLGGNIVTNKNTEHLRETKKTFGPEVGKSKAVRVHDMKISEQWDYSSIPSKPRQQMGMSNLFHAPLLYRWYPLNRRLGRPQNRHESFGEEINLLPMPGIKPRLLTRTSRFCLATIPNTLSRFTYLTPDVIGDHMKEGVARHLVGMDEMENT